MISSKQDEISMIHNNFEQANNDIEDLRNKVREQEGMINDLETKNKKLVDLLNSNIYNKAESYKEKVLNKL